MRPEDIVIGEFQELIPGVEIAEVTGDQIDVRCRILGMTSIFADPAQAELLNFETVMEARQSATRASDAVRAATYVGELEPEVQLIFFSQTGALAVKGSDVLENKTELAEIVRMLDGGNENISCLTGAAIVT